MAKINPTLMRKIRHRRVRKKVMGIPLRPRLNIFRSLNHIYAQIIDDSQGHSLVAMSTLDPTVRNRIDGMSKTEKAKAVGTLLAEKALNRGIKQVVFDRGGYKYHGRIKALAEAARQAGLEL
ncbi:MAG: 50S ribosomal protein L18 [Chloroflexi bacterium CG_4_8_14_3_um_filter_45_15]|nr:MAG: 50S ribosomal protein L18 [Chloroflexi bacterium CG_4_8_14_3_um_filter_45_15]